MSQALITSADNSTDGSSIHPIIPSGAPALTAASKHNFAAAIVQFLALGCGENTIPFLDFNAIKHLNIAVEVGFVVGIIPAKTPTGYAILVIPNASSFSIIPQVLTSLYALYMYSDA